ncbi:MAG: hypothetical protein H7Y15_04060, partial [Pseudonocardia sp.]|nr:hypothetical protein [Pseudonocardia sp.]
MPESSVPESSESETPPETPESETEPSETEPETSESEPESSESETLPESPESEPETPESETEPEWDSLPESSESETEPEWDSLPESLLEEGTLTETLLVPEDGSDWFVNESAGAPVTFEEWVSPDGEGGQSYSDGGGQTFGPVVSDSDSSGSAPVRYDFSAGPVTIADASSAVQERSGDSSPEQPASGNADAFTSGPISIGDFDIEYTGGGWENVAFRDAAGESFRLGDVVEQFSTNGASSPSFSLDVPQSVLESIRLPQSVRDLVAAQGIQLDSVATGSIAATTGEPTPIQVAPGLSFTPARVNTGSARVDVDLDQNRVGVGGLGSDQGQIAYERSGTQPQGGGVNTAGSTSTVVTLNPQTNQSIYLAGGPVGDTPDQPDRLNVRTTNVGSVYAGNLPSDEPPTGNRSASWRAVGARAGAAGNVMLTNSDGSIRPSGTLTPSGSLFATAGNNNPDNRWNADANLTVSPRYSFGPNGSDWQTTTSASANANYEIGDRRIDGNFAGDTDGDGRGAGSVVSAGVFGQYTNVDSGQVTIPRFGTVDADTTQYRVGGRAGFELREDQPRFEAGVQVDGTAGVQGSSIETDFGSSSSGPTPFVNARASGDVEFRTAPRTESGAYIRADGSAALDVAGDRTTYSAQVTPRVGGDVVLSGDTRLGANVGYRVGLTNETTRPDGSTSGGPYSGVVAGVGTEFNAFGGRGTAGVEYSAANPDGGNSVAFRVGYTPGGATRQAPRTPDAPFTIPNATDVAQFDPNAATAVGVSNTSVLTPLLVASAGAPNVTTDATAATTVDSAPGPQQSGASALQGTSSVGIDLVSPALVDTAGPVPVASVLDGALTTGPVASFDGAGALSIDPSVTVPGAVEALDVQLDRPLLDLPPVTSVATADVAPVLDGALTYGPVASFDGSGALSVDPSVTVPGAVEALDVQLDRPLLDLPPVTEV